MSWAPSVKRSLVLTRWMGNTGRKGLFVYSFLQRGGRCARARHDLDLLFGLGNNVADPEMAA